MSANKKRPEAMRSEAMTIRKRRIAVLIIGALLIAGATVAVRWHNEIINDLALTPRARQVIPA
jgi:hypothetical protein